MRDFNHSVNILVQAYLNDTLKHGDCRACAVGNIITANGHELPDHWSQNGQWLWFIRKEFRNDPSGANEFGLALAVNQIRSTGYSAYELHLIEYAFEEAENPKQNKFIDNDEWMFNGLMAVVDVLAEIHGIDLTQREEAKLLFVKA